MTDEHEELLALGLIDESGRLTPKGELTLHNLKTREYTLRVIIPRKVRYYLDREWPNYEGANRWLRFCTTEQRNKIIAEVCLGVKS